MNRKEKIRFSAVILAVLAMTVGMLITREPEAVTITIPAHTYTTK